MGPVSQPCLLLPTHLTSSQVASTAVGPCLKLRNRLLPETKRRKGRRKEGRRRKKGGRYPQKCSSQNTSLSKLVIRTGKHSLLYLLSWSLPVEGSPVLGLTSVLNREVASAKHGWPICVSVPGSTYVCLDKWKQQVCGHHSIILHRTHFFKSRLNIQFEA